MAHQRTNSRFRSTLLLPLLGLLAVAACGNSSTEPDGAGGAGSSSGGSASSGAGSTPTAGTGTAGSTAGTPAAGGGGSGASGGPATGGAGSSGTSAGAGGGGAANGGAPAAGAGGAGGNGGSAGAAGSGGTGGAGTATLHIFMLMGQSNMVGVARAQDSDKNTDQRLKVWGGCKQKAGQWNVATPPLNDCPGESGINLDYTVDPGIWFAKTLLKKLPAGDTIGLVGTAESGEKIETFITGGKHHDMIMKKIAAVKTAQNARFAGVIFHQGESNFNQPTWPGLVVQLYTEVKQAFGVSYDVPFILGELPNGGCCSGHNTRVREAATKLPMGAYVTQEGTKVMDEYHFDHDSVVLMGTRYGDKMVEMLKW